MGRVKIKFPEVLPLYQTELSVRISDLNYGNHLANDAVLRLAHEVRMQWLSAHGFTELETGGHGLIMADAAISFRSEAFYGESLWIELFADELGPHGFDLLYRMGRREGREVALVKTGMVSFDYSRRRIVPIGEVLKKILGAG